MKTDTVITLDGIDRYYLADETIQNGIKYFLATKVDEENDLTTESCIFEEIIQDEKPYVREVNDEHIIKYITAVFTTNIVSDVEAEKEED